MEQATFFDLAVSMDVQKESFIRMNRKETQEKKSQHSGKDRKKKFPSPFSRQRSAGWW